MGGFIPPFFFLTFTLCPRPRGLSVLLNGIVNQAAPGSVWRDSGLLAIGEFLAYGAHVVSDVGDYPDGSSH